MTSQPYRHVAIGVVILFITARADSSTYYVSTSGDDSGAGSLSHPFASLARAQQAASAGDTVYIRGGTYSQFSIAATNSAYQFVLNFTKSNIQYLAYPGDARPVLDFSNVAPTSLRVCGIQVTGSGNTFQGIDVTGVKAGTLKQADNWRISGSANTFRQITTHDDEGNGMYVFGQASNNRIVNCDSYNLVGIKGTSAGNTDGFGVHASGTGNVLQGDRAWGNSDDGFDCINNSGGGVTFDHCWAYDNGRLDGNKNGFKIGGFGDTGGDFPDPPPVHTVQFCISANNGANGFYANHQPGQSANWSNNTAFNNKSANFNMLEAIDTTPENSSVPGTREVMHNNLAYQGTAVANLNESGALVAANSFTLPVTVNASDFVSVDPSQLTLPRQADGSLPAITFMHLQAGSDLVDAGIDVGLPFSGKAPDLGAFELPEPRMVAIFSTALQLTLRRRR